MATRPTRHSAHTPHNQQCSHTEWTLQQHNTRMWAACCEQCLQRDVSYRATAALGATTTNIPMHTRARAYSICLQRRQCRSQHPVGGRCSIGTVNVEAVKADGQRASYRLCALQVAACGRNPSSSTRSPTRSSRSLSVAALPCGELSSSASCCQRLHRRRLHFLVVHTSSAFTPPLRFSAFTPESSPLTRELARRLRRRH